MPSVSILFAPTNLASDDLDLPAQVCAAFHVALLSLSVAVLVGYETRAHGQGPHATAFAACLCAVCICSLVLEALVWWQARQGAKLCMPHALACTCSAKAHHHSVPILRAYWHTLRLPTCQTHRMPTAAAAP